jgi:hypothetical protein
VGRSFWMESMFSKKRMPFILAGSDVNGDGFPFNDRVGNLGRNTYRGDSYYDTDVRLQRLFSLTERVKANVSAEFLNLLNRVNVQDVDQVYGAASSLAPYPGDMEMESPARQIRPLEPQRLPELHGRFSFR